MKRHLIFTLLLICQFVTGNLFSQVQKKIDYHYSRSNRSLLGLAFLAYVFSSTDDIREAIKIRGIDDSLTADNIIEVKLNTDSIKLSDINAMRIVNDSQALFFGTWYTKDFNLDSQELKKNIISRKNNEGVIELMKVHTDKNGRRYVNDWSIDGQVLVHDSLIETINISNDDFWVDNEKQQRKLVNRFNFMRGGFVTAAMVTSGIILLIKYRR